MAGALLAPHLADASSSDTPLNWQAVAAPQRVRGRSPAVAHTEALRALAGLLARRGAARCGGGGCRASAISIIACHRRDRLRLHLSVRLPLRLALCASKPQSQAAPAQTLATTSTSRRKAARALQVELEPTRRHPTHDLAIAEGHVKGAVGGSGDDTSGEGARLAVVLPA